MSPNLRHALHILHETGHIQLPGEPLVWTDTAKNVLLAAIIFMTLLCLVGVAFPLTFAIASGSLLLMLISGGFVILPVLVTVFVWTNYRRLLRKYPPGSEREPVVLEPRGLTMRGVGPIAWTDFGPAQYRLVSGEVRGAQTRAVLPLSPSGAHKLNTGLPVHIRGRLSPPTTFGLRIDDRYMYVPGVVGLTDREAMELINRARQMYAPQHFV